MIDALISGRLHSKPVERTGTSGRPFVVAKVRVTDGSGEAHFANVIAFDQGACAGLLALGDGDSVALAGSLTPKLFQPAKGPARVSLDFTAHAVLTAYSVARKRKATSKAKSAPAHGNEPQQAFLDDDEVSF